MELRLQLRVRAFFALATALLAVSTVFGILISQPAKAAQSIPYKVNFQGRLTDNNGNVLADGSYNIKFRIFDAATVGTNQWEGDRVYGVSDNRITITNGLFNIQFGDTTKGDPALSPALFSGVYPLYLEVELPTPASATCATNGCAVFTEGAMTPRQPLASSPYAFNSDTLDGLDSAAFGQLGSAQSWTGTNTYSKTAGAALALTGTAASAGAMLQFGSVASLTGGSANGTYVGANPTSYTGDFINFGINGVNKLKVDTTGNLTLGAGALITVGSTPGLSATTCSGGTYLQNQAVTGGITTGGTCVTPTGTGAATDLSNLTTTSISQSLLPNANNTLTVGSLAKVWQHVYTADIDAGTTTTALTVGTAATTTAVTIGRAGVAVSLPGGLTTSNGTINTGNGTITSTGAITGGSFKIGANDINTGGGSPTLVNVDYLDAAQSMTATKSFTKSGGQGAVFSGTAASGGAQLQFGGVATLASGSANGTYVGANAAAYTGDFINFQINSVNKLKVDNTGAVTTGSTVNGTTLNGGSITGGSLTSSSVNGLAVSGTAVQGTGSLAVDGTGGGTVSIGAVSTGDVLLAGGSGAAGCTVTNASGNLACSGVITGSGYVGSSLDTATATTLNLGTVTANAVVIGNATAATTVQINGGTTALNAIGLTAATNGGILATTTGTGNIELDSASSIIAQSTTNSATAFQIQNSGGVSILNVDTATGAVANLLSNSGFEKNPMTNWSNLGSGVVARDTTQEYIGFASGKVTAGVTAGGGVSQAVTLGLSTQYTMSFYAKLDAGSAALTTLQAGYSSTGAAGGEVDCALNSTTVITAGWNRFICTFTTPGTNSGTPYIFIQHNDTTSEAFYVDSVQVETGSFATPYGQGLISLNATINSPINFQENANSATAFQITNMAGTNILNVDTLNNNLSNQATNPSFETGLTGWAQRTGCTLTQDATGGYNGTSSAKCTNTATAGAGMNLTGISPVMVSGTTYTMSMYVKASANMTTLEIGRSDTGLPAGDTVCLTAQTVTSLGWKRFTCTFTAGAQSGTPYIYVRQTDATVRTIWVDAVLMETDANASTNYRDGRLSLGNATISSPAVFQTNTNSTTAFQIQNAAGIQVFNVDTASDTGLVANSGFEVNSAGWSTMNGATNLVRDTSKTYVGIASGKVTTTATSQSGMRYTFPTQLPAVAATAYTISAYVQVAAADATFTMGYNSGSDANCTVSPAASATVPSTNGWTRFTCQTPVNTAINSIFITSGTTAATLNVDGVRVESGSVATAFGNSNISFNGVFTSPVAIRSPNDTTTEFQVQTAASTSLFTVDSLNKNIIVGDGFSATDTTAVTLALDSSSTYADTATCSNTAGGGSIYYNSTANTIRACIRDSVNTTAGWEDLPSTNGLGAILFGVVPDSGLSANQGNWASINGANLGPCKVAWASATSVSVAPCTAYSAGRKVVVASATTVTMPAMTTSQWVHVCFNAAGVPAASGAGTEIANMPTFSVNNPSLCLADIFNSTVTANTIAKIYDYRTFTTTQKEFVTNQTTAASLGQTVSTMAATNSVTQVPTTTNTSILRGVVVATNGSTSATAVTAIIATRGPQWVKFAAAAGTINAYLQPITGGVAGYVSSSATAGTVAYGNLGLQLRVSDNTTCNAATTCQMSVPTDLNLR